RLAGGGAGAGRRRGVRAARVPGAPGGGGPAHPRPQLREGDAHAGPAGGPAGLGAA
ncbi:unnamed protein product, partial [Heterosigma akashiwo]